MVVVPLGQSRNHREKNSLGGRTIWTCEFPNYIGWVPETQERVLSWGNKSLGVICVDIGLKSKWMSSQRVKVKGEGDREERGRSLGHGKGRLQKQFWYLSSSETHRSCGKWLNDSSFNYYAD